MKKVFFLFGLCLITMAAVAAPVSQEAALAKARAFLQKDGSNRSSLRLAPARRSMTATAADGFYVFNVGTEQGFVLVSADDRTPAILGYADQGSFDEATIPAHVKSWLAGYSDEIRNLKSNPAPALQPLPRKVAIRRSIAPLIQSLWNQDAPFNNNLPLFIDGQRSVTGCVSTAMSQMMRYYCWPQATTAAIPGYECARGYIVENQEVHIQVPGIPAGVQFDWANLPYVYGADATDAQKQAVATLMQVCGAATQTDYADGINGGSQTANAEVETAFKKYLNYSEGISHVYRSDYTMEDWNEMMYKEIRAGRPVMMGGTSSVGGHAFIVDGFGGDCYFHINWGWGGACNGYYLLSATNPYLDVDGYTMDQDAVIGIEPRKSEDVQFVQRPMTGDILSVIDNAETGNKEVEFSCFSNLSGTHQFNMAIGYITPADTFKVISDTEATPEMERGYGFGSFTLPLIGMEDGTYKVVPLAKEITEKTWQCLYGDYARSYVEVIKSGKDMLARIIRPTVDLKVTSITPQSEAKVGSPLSILMEVENNGMEYYGPLYLFAGGSPTQVGRVAIQGVSLRSGVKTTVEFIFTPSTSGENTLCVATDAEATNIIGVGTLPVEQVPFGVESLEVVGFTYNDVDVVSFSSFEYNGVNYNLGGEFAYQTVHGLLSGSVRIKNNSAAPYDGSLIIIFLATDDMYGTLFFQTSGWAQIGTKGEFSFEAHLKPGEEADVPFTFTSLLEDGVTYIPVLLSKSGTQLANANVNDLFQYLSGAITYASDGTLRGVEVKETMEFDDKTIAVKFDEKAAVNELKAANPNTLYYFQSAEQIPASLTSNAVVGSEAETIVIQDGYLFAPLYEFKAKNISYVRNFTPRLNGKGEGWETIALPFDVQKVEANGKTIDWYRPEDDERAAKQFQLLELSEEDGQRLTFKPAESMAAFTPYMIGFPNWDDKEMAVTFSGTNTNVELDPVPCTFTGPNFVMVASMEDQKVEGALTLNAEGTMFQKGSGEVAAYRAYIENNTFSKENYIAALISYEELVGVRNVETSTTVQPTELYTLDGRRVQRPAKAGIYVSGNKKFIVK